MAYKGFEEAGLKGGRASKEGTLGEVRWGWPLVRHLPGSLGEGVRDAPPTPILIFPMYSSLYYLVGSFWPLLLFRLLSQAFQA